MMYKIINKLSHLHFEHYFYYQDNSYTFRKSNLKVLPKLSLIGNIWFSSFFERGPKYWNKLDENITTSTSLYTFKQKLNLISYHDFLL